LDRLPFGFPWDWLNRPASFESTPATQAPQSPSHRHDGARQSLINIVWRLITSGSLGHETNV
jgi:hypothetical protein